MAVSLTVPVLLLSQDRIPFQTLTPSLTLIQILILVLLVGAPVNLLVRLTQHLTLTKRTTAM